MTTLVFLLEEPSARDLLEGVLPRLLPATVVVKYMIFRAASRISRAVWSSGCAGS